MACTSLVSSTTVAWMMLEVWNFCITMSDITENDMVTAQLIDAGRKNVKGGLEGFGKGIGWREDYYMVSMNASWQSLRRKT